MTGFVIGVDGCRAGWVACRRERSGAAGFEVFPSLDALWDSARRADLVLVDVPIGVPGGADGDGVRVCDLAAKRLLGKYNSRVFLTPCREALACASYPEGNAMSRSLTGRGLSKQLWMIAPKIREMDAFLGRAEGARERIRECHPEICFVGLGGGVIPENKLKPEGIARRLELLGGLDEGLVELIERTAAGMARKVAGIDDLIDAAVGAWTAAGVWDGSLRTLPTAVPSDPLGYPMEMVYRERAGRGVLSGG